METATVKTEKTVFGGNSIAKIGSKTVFIPYSMPNETLSVNIVQHKNDYDNAEILKIIEASPYRVEPPCKYYALCGGCNMMHISTEYQRELRKNMLYEALKNNGIEVQTQIECVYGPDFNYRSRFQLNDGGLTQKNSRNSVKIDGCLCAEEPVNEYLKNVDAEKRPKNRTHIFGSSFMTEGTAGNEAGTGACTGASQGACMGAGFNEAGGLGAKIRISEGVEKDDSRNGASNSGRNGKSVEKNRHFNKKYNIKENHYFAGTIIQSENIVTVKLNGKNISFDVRGFFQSNLFVFEKVLNLIQSLLPGGDNILDMYSGCGAISAFLADKYKNVTLVEHNRDALVFAEQNMAGKTHVSYGLSGEKWVKDCASYAGPFDACMIDPPRSGMESAVRDYLCKSNIPVILSMSCDPATHARDLSKLIASGYSLERIFLLDFYPHTSHIESLALLIKN